MTLPASNVFANIFQRVALENSGSMLHANAYSEIVAQLPSVIVFFARPIAFFLGRSPRVDSLMHRAPLISIVSQFLLGYVALVDKSTVLDDERAPRKPSKAKSNLPQVWDVIVIGSGPGGSIAALRAAEANKTVLVLETGEQFEPGTIEHHSLDQTRKEFRNSGLNFIWGTKPILFAEGETVGGGSEVNSGLYHRLVGEHRVRILKSLDVSEETWSELEVVVESEISVQAAPNRVEPHYGLVRGARNLNLETQEIPRWRKYSPVEEHQSMQVTYLAKAAKLGVQIIENQKVTCVIPTTQSLTVSAVSAIGEETFYQGNEVVLAAGTIGTPTILHKSRLSRGNFDLNFHPMLRAVSRQDELINTGDLFPSWQAWTPDLRLKYGYSVSSYPFLSATLSSLGEGKRFSEAELSTMAAYFGSFALSDSKVHLRTFRKNLVPVIHWGRIDKKSLIEVSIQLRKLLESGDSIEFWPKTGLSPITTVHLFGSIPISRSSLVDSRGRLISDSRIRVSDASIMPYATWGNPQGAIMVMCELMAQRWERGE